MYFILMFVIKYVCMYVSIYECMYLSRKAGRHVDS